jgi:hypothetical protein
METTQTSLTSPNDRLSSQFKPAVNTVPLSVSELKDAMNELNDISYVTTFPKVERVYADPSIMNQTYCLCSFIPSSGATPDKDGIFGMMKVRGAFQTLEEASQRSEFLIQNVDSYHKIYTCYVGRPFPITTSSKYSQETSEVDIRNKVTKVISDDIKMQKRKEKEEIDDIKKREEDLISDSKKDEEDPLDVYTTLRVKKAQLIWTYLETRKKMDQMKDSIIKTRKEIVDMDNENSDYLKQYRDKYMEARNKAGIKDNDDSFMAYLGEDVDESILGF